MTNKPIDSAERYTAHSIALLLLVLQVAFASPLSAQSTSPKNRTSAGSQFPSLSGLDDLLETGDSAAPVGPAVTTSSRIVTFAESDEGLLQVAADIAAGYHLYSLTQPEGGPQPTQIVLEDSDEFEIIGPFSPDVAPVVEPSDVFDVAEHFHEGRVVWTAAIQFRAGVDPTKVQVRGHLKGQACTNGNCLPLQAAKTAFTGVYAQSIPLPSTPLGVGSSASTVTSLFRFETLKYLIFALLGGFILNFMPCVLPVIGLKIMSFAQQAGQDPKHVFRLNVAFVAGLTSVFMVLACLAIFLGWGWGHQFQRPEFSIFLVSIVFVFALSFLGVWEIPIPGFVGTGKAAEISQKEGLAGAFLKGVLTTLLATPCSGPLIVPTLTWALRQPTPLVFGTFFCMGLGMGLPYIVIGLSPNLTRLLPKPGGWMETFKEVMGFVLLATVVWIFGSIDPDYFLPTLGLLFTLWGACWWIGRVPITAEWKEKAWGYTTAGLFALVLGTGLFRVYAVEHEYHWENFSPTALNAYRNDGKPVFVDFTADWCLTCKVNERSAVKTPKTQAFLEEHGIVPLIADFTKENPAADRLLEDLGNESKGIPYYAVFPADGSDPIAFNDFPLTQAKLLERLQSAVTKKDQEIRNGSASAHALR